MTLCLIGTPDPGDREPTAVELLMLEAERPVLEAELAVVAAECAYLASPSALARARVRRAELELGRVHTTRGRIVPDLPASLVRYERPGGKERTESDDVEGVA